MHIYRVSTALRAVAALRRLRSKLVSSEAWHRGDRNEVEMRDPLGGSTGRRWMGRPGVFSGLCPNRVGAWTRVRVDSGRLARVCLLTLDVNNSRMEDNSRMTFGRAL